MITIHSWLNYEIMDATQKLNSKALGKIGSLQSILYSKKLPIIQITHSEELTRVHTIAT